MAFVGNTRDMGSFGEETDEITDLHQILEEVLLTKCGDGVTGIKQCRRIEFRKLEEFCDEKGISQNFSSPCTPEQNGVAERRNITLIEAARTISIIVKWHGTTAYDVFRGIYPDISYFYVFGCPVHIHNHIDRLRKFDEKADDGFFLGYSPVAKAFRVFNIKRQEIEESYHVTFSEYDKAISQASIEGDAVNFNENRSFPDDEFLEPRNKVTHSSGNVEYLPYEPHVFPIADNHPVQNELDHSESADNLEPVKVEDLIINESISRAKPSPTITSPATEIISNPLVPQYRWSRKKHIELVNIIGKHLAGVTIEVGSETLKLHQLINAYM
ncbi:retrovirus-related pol polyprotein from transposon TNT 1-94 [Tanacetum coccineum]|uniref:Retrovirus-related pol polyprotein from transposon TNT 1-94 n=1 Tax=Tanacetum coccineum TaxID=301880 RepID=A0ABQ5FWY3_9ASTR